jgi:hypothetical protein
MDGRRNDRLGRLSRRRIARHRREILCTLSGNANTISVSYPCDTYPHYYTYAANTHAYTYLYASESHAHSYCHDYTYSDGYGNDDCHCDTHSDFYRDTHCNGYRGAYRNTYGNADRHTCYYTHGDANRHTYGDANTEHFRKHLDATSCGDGR